MYKNISMTQLRDDVARIIPAKHIFYVIDACYSGTLLAQRANVYYAHRRAILTKNQKKRLHPY